uniref:hypothetical protein n=1 Tax=Enterococcus faecalis TaxID=1351 RepID=UPI0015CA2358
MKQETYVALKDEYEAKIDALKEDLADLKNRYIDSQKELKIGTKVKITTPRYQAWGLARPNEKY